MEYSTLYRELVNSTEMIRAMLSGIDQEQAAFKPDAKSWSILEVICHLHDIEREDFREHLDFILNRQDEEYHAIDPQEWVTSRNYNGQNFAEMQEKFFAERTASLAWLKTISEADWDATYTSEYGSVSAGEMFSCWIAHDNLHIRQLVGLRRIGIESITKPYPLGYAGDW